MPAADHERRAADHAEAHPASCAVLTVSDTRTAQTDQSGPLIERLLTERGHRITARALVRDEPPTIAGQLKTWLADPGLDVILTTGGTGISTRDTTIEVVRRLLTMELEGFGVDREEKKLMWEEATRQCVRMMTETPYPGYEGAYFGMPERNVIPKPYQKPHPPLWVASSRRETTMVAARLGMGSLGFAFETPPAASPPGID